MTNGKAKYILLIEPSTADAHLIKTALTYSSFKVNVSNVATANAALQFLRRESPYEHAQSPDLILLEPNFPNSPVISEAEASVGFRLLDQLKKDPVFSRIPLIILSSTDLVKVINYSYDLHANAFISKDSNYEALKRNLHGLMSYWFQVVVLPR